MASRRKRMAEALLSLSLLFGTAAQAQTPLPPAPPAPPAAQTQTLSPAAQTQILSPAPFDSLSDHFTLKANPAAPVYAPELWNDGDEDRLGAFYTEHEPEISKIERTEGWMDLWPLATLLRRESNQTLHKNFGFTLEEAASLRRDFASATAGVQFRTNCYAYAVDHPQENPPGWKLSPGEIAGLGILDEKDITAGELIRRVEADGLLPAGQEPKQKPGYYLVALFVIPGDDFHFARQNRDGSWSQKNGIETVTALDFSNEPISDPRQADFGDYKFVSYFYVPEGGLKFDALHLPLTPPVNPKPAAKLAQK